MANTPAVREELVALAKAHLLAKSAFNRAFVRFFQSEISPCSDETGWKIMGVFRNEVETFCFKYNRRERGIEQAAWEIFRLELVGDADYRFEDAAGFVKWYQKLKNKIAVAIGHLYDFRGDSFGDLVDSYPLAGSELVERALASHPNSGRPRREGYIEEREVEATILNNLGAQWHKLICQGENYVAIGLETALYKCYLRRVLTAEREQVVWTEEEQDAVSFAGQYDQ